MIVSFYSTVVTSLLLSGTESEIDELELDDIDLDVFDSDSEDEGLTMTPSTSASQSRSQSSGESVNASSPVMPKGMCFMVILRKYRGYALEKFYRLIYFNNFTFS